MSAERQFENELETFRKDAEGAAQFFYAYLAITRSPSATEVSWLFSTSMP